MSLFLSLTYLSHSLIFCNIHILIFLNRNAPMPFLMGIEDHLLYKAEENINDGTYIIDLDHDKITSK